MRPTSLVTHEKKLLLWSCLVKKKRRKKEVMKQNIKSCKLIVIIFSFFIIFYRRWKWNKFIPSNLLIFSRYENYDIWIKRRFSWQELWNSRCRYTIVKAEGFYSYWFSLVSTYRLQHSQWSSLCSCELLNYSIHLSVPWVELRTSSNQINEQFPSLLINQES